jgi:hypothetical protein
MAELDHLDEKLAEVLGLANAAQVATERVSTLAKHEELDDVRELMRRMTDEAGEVADRCQAIADTREGMKTAIAQKARETAAEVEEFMRNYLEDAETLDGLEFLTMAEAGEIIHWEILAKLNETAKDEAITALTEFAIPLQQTHIDSVHDCALELASDEDPHET